MSREAWAATEWTQQDTSYEITGHRPANKRAAEETSVSKYFIPLLFSFSHPKAPVLVKIDFAALYLAVIVQSASVPEATKALAERQLTIGNPSTGIWPPGPPDTPISECRSVWNQRERRAQPVSLQLSFPAMAGAMQRRPPMEGETSASAGAGQAS